jgi:hypothetical protein
MTQELNEMAMRTVGTESSPFFVTLLTNTEFDGAAFTVAAFVSLIDAVRFASTMRTNANESLVIEGPQGVYIDTSERGIPSFVDEGFIAQIN